MRGFWSFLLVLALTSGCAVHPRSEVRTVAHLDVPCRTTGGALGSSVFMGPARPATPQELADPARYGRYACLGTGAVAASDAGGGAPTSERFEARVDEAIRAGTTPTGNENRTAIVRTSGEMP